MKKKTPHLDNLEKCNCSVKETISNSKLTYISAHNRLTTSQTNAAKIRMNKFATQYVYTFRDTNRTIVPPRNKF